MELRHLRYFVAVAEAGSFTRAAQALFIAQPPLSSQIRDLEAEVGAPLLVRHVRGVTLTPAGERVLADAREILARAERLKRDGAREAGSAKTTLAIGFIASASDFLLPQVLPVLRRRHPGLTIDVREMLSTEQLAALQTGDIDAALCRPPVRAKMLSIAAQCADPFCLAIPRGHVLAEPGELRLESAAGADFVAFKRDQARAFFDQTLAFCTEAGLSPAVRCEAGTVFGVLRMVSAGMGVAIVPASVATAAGDGIVLRRLVRPTRPGALLLVRRRIDRDPAVADLVSLTERAFAALRRVVERKLTSR